MHFVNYKTNKAVATYHLVHGKLCEKTIMALYVNTNVSSINAQRKLANSTLALNTSYQRLSSGLRINSSKDDAAGLQIADRLTSQINGLN